MFRGRNGPKGRGLVPQRSVAEMLRIVLSTILRAAFRATGKLDLTWFGSIGVGASRQEQSRIHGGGDAPRALDKTIAASDRPAQ